GVPPAVHVGFAEAERAVREHARIQALVVHAQVDRRAAVDVDVRLRQQFAGAIFQVVLAHCLAPSRSVAGADQLAPSTAKLAGWRAYVASRWLRVPVAAASRPVPRAAGTRS